MHPPLDIPIAKTQRQARGENLKIEQKKSIKHLLLHKTFWDSANQPSLINFMTQTLFFLFVFVCITFVNTLSTINIRCDDAILVLFVFLPG